MESDVELFFGLEATSVSGIMAEVRSVLVFSREVNSHGPSGLLEYMGEVGRWVVGRGLSLCGLGGGRVVRRMERIGWEGTSDVIVAMLESDEVHLSRDELVEGCRVGGVRGCRLAVCAGVDNGCYEGAKYFGLQRLSYVRDGFVEQVGEFDLLRCERVAEWYIVKEGK